MKYWIARNTFGPKWGDKGDFYIRRGENDFGIESEVNAYSVKLAWKKAIIIFYLYISIFYLRIYKNNW